MADVQDVQVDDRVQLRKPHPCGQDIWVVYRVGADIGLRCTGCRRRMLLSRREFGKRVKRVARGLV